MLKDLDEAINAQGISLVFAEMKDPVRRKIDRYELTQTIDPAHFFATLDAAVSAYQQRHRCHVERWRPEQAELHLT